VLVALVALLHEADILYYSEELIGFSENRSYSNN